MFMQEAKLLVEQLVKGECASEKQCGEVFATPS